MASWDGCVPIESQGLADEECNKDIVKPEECAHCHTCKAELAKRFIRVEDVCIENEYRDLNCCNG